MSVKCDLRAVLRFSLSIPCLFLALAATPIEAMLPGGASAQTSLPTINVGGHTVRRSEVRRAPRPERPIRVTAPVHLSPPTTVNSVVPETSDGFDSSAQQNTALGPKIDYPMPPKDLPSSSERFFTGGQVNTIPAFRPGEALEVVPGLAVTQHAGEGKANQYFLRGFDLDHGTDLALYLDSMPLNMLTHGHATGLFGRQLRHPRNAWLPMIDARRVPYKRPRMATSPTPARSECSICGKCPRACFRQPSGIFNYGRVFGMKSWEFAGGDIFGGGEISTYDGPWQIPNKARKINAVLRWSQGERKMTGMSITGMAYANRWNSTDQIPTRVIDTGILVALGHPSTPRMAATPRASAFLDDGRRRRSSMTGRRSKPSPCIRHSISTTTLPIFSGIPS